jgi:hypothetical protein
VPVGAVGSAIYAGALLRASLGTAERIAAEGEGTILERLTRPGE